MIELSSYRHHDNIILKLLYAQFAHIALPLSEMKANAKLEAASLSYKIL